MCGDHRVGFEKWGRLAPLLDIEMNGRESRVCLSGRENGGDLASRDHE